MTITCNVLRPIPFDPVPFVADVMRHLNIADSVLEFTFVDNPTIHDLNRRHLTHDWPTDIITFDLSDDTLAGDLYISVDQAEIQGQELGHTLEKELKILIIHGILHLVGYDDQSDDAAQVMHAMQDKIYDAIT